MKKRVKFELMWIRWESAAATDVFYRAWLATYPNIERGITVEDIEDSYKDDFSAEKIGNLKELIRNLPKNKKRLVAKNGDMIVGVCTVIRNEDNNHLRTYCSSRRLHSKCDRFL
ncbi:MAG: hypothetical protein P4L61_01275 [Candidatus Pacebacteria bacterium]|nr:hypothetical protein [Candidatus Paceibacterota bacterium]